MSSSNVGVLNLGRNRLGGCGWDTERFSAQHLVSSQESRKWSVGRSAVSVARHGFSLWSGESVARRGIEWRDTLQPSEVLPILTDALLQADILFGKKLSSVSFHLDEFLRFSKSALDFLSLIFEILADLCQGVKLGL